MKRQIIVAMSSVMVAMTISFFMQNHSASAERSDLSYTDVVRVYAPESPAAVVSVKIADPHGLQDALN